MNLARKLLVLAFAASAAIAAAQVPDMVTAIDAGGRAMGAGSALNLTSVSTLSSTYNPAALGFMTHTEFGIASRNLPATKTQVDGPVNDLRLDSETESGGLGLGHVGLALPLGGGSGGVLGIAYTLAGWFHDTQQGVGLDNGVATFFDFTRARTDFLTISFGKASGDQRFSWGAGLVAAQQSLRNVRTITFTDPNVPPETADTDTTGNGFGFQAGFMMTPSGQSNMTFGASVRTPIRINREGTPLDVYNEIPGRAAAGIAVRRDGFRGGRDFLILGAEAQYFFGGEESPRIDRENQLTGHFGAEYNYEIGSATLPIRIGYALVPAGGHGFADRNTFTYGIGYRPHKGDWTLELNFGTPNGGGTDTAIFFSYRFGK